ncbi:phytoene desaturase family protein [Nocardia nova]|uniref:phytoene desaturase family protein n=2 Tax=Nocardia nova TaxID=37330 RepID=UPI002B4B248C|nr:NAD(P)/FAD-dependent oxidoreductase [Nocardia nova]
MTSPAPGGSTPLDAEPVDAVIIGGGHNGLVSAALLADHGWDVAVLEAEDAAGGAVRSAELVPGYRMDLFSAFYPMAGASPALRDLGLDDHGLRWSRAPIVYGHPSSPEDTDAAVVHPDAEATAEALARRDPRDGRTWLRLVEQWRQVREHLLGSFLGPFPPVRGAAGLWRDLGSAELFRYLRFLILPVGRMVDELFHDEAAKLLILGNAMHADVPVDAPGSGVYGYLLTMLAQDGGFPVPVGGAGALIAALVHRAESAGARVHCGQPVDRVLIRDGRAAGVITAAGQVVRARKAVIADIDAPTLYTRLLADADLPQRLRADLERFTWDAPTVKVNYALSEPIPWRSKQLRAAGTVHLGADRAGLARWTTDIGTGVVPHTPFMLFGQMTTADPSRSAPGTESAWAYTHLPRGVTDDASADLLAERVDAVLEAHAPGFGSRIHARIVQRPSDLQGADGNLVGGAVNGGTSQLHQQLVFRPVPGLGRPETVVPGLYLGSASAHPGGGVHGTCGANAARAALADSRPTGWPRRKLLSRLHNALYDTDR